MSHGSSREFALKSFEDKMLTVNSEEEDPEEYPFPLTLRTKQPDAAASPLEGALNGH